MTLGQKWAYNPHDVYKSTKVVVQTLVSVVATGGSLLLDIGPMPTGELPPTALSRLAEVGKWMDVNAEAIHGTVPQPPYAINVTLPASSLQNRTWTLVSAAASRKSAECSEAGANKELPLARCKAHCSAMAGCDTGKDYHYARAEGMTKLLGKNESTVEVEDTVKKSVTVGREESSHSAPLPKAAKSPKPVST